MENLYKLGKYKETDRMCDLICDHYPMLLVMSRFGIPLGFGDKSIREVCAENGVDTDTFLAVVNLLREEGTKADTGNVSVESLISYLRNSHDYFLEFRLPAIRRKLIEAIDCRRSDVSFAVLRFFDEYAGEVRKHMQYEEETVFPYVESLLTGRTDPAYNIGIFRKRHDQVEARLSELKNILIKYYPAESSNELNGVLFDIFSCQRDLASHNYVEDHLVVPSIVRLERERGGRS